MLPYGMRRRVTDSPERGTRIGNAEQLKVLIKFMEKLFSDVKSSNHYIYYNQPQLAFMSHTDYVNKQKEMWKELTSLLNSIEGGYQKSLGTWRSTWVSRKRQAKTKKGPLNSFEKRILQISRKEERVKYIYNYLSKKQNEETATKPRENVTGIPLEQVSPSVPQPTESSLPHQASNSSQQLDVPVQHISNPVQILSMLGPQLSGSVQQSSKPLPQSSMSIQKPLISKQSLMSVQHSLIPGQQPLPAQQNDENRKIDDIQQLTKAVNRLTDVLKNFLEKLQ